MVSVADCYRSFVQKSVGRHLIEIKPLDTVHFASKSRIIGRSNQVFQKLTELVLKKQFILLQGISGTGKTTTMQMFVKRHLADVNLHLNSPFAFPVACRIQLRSRLDKPGVEGAVRMSIGLPKRMMCNENVLNSNAVPLN